MVSIHNYEKRYKRTLERIEASSEISTTNKKHIVGFKDHLLSEGIGIAKIERYLGDLIKFNRLLGKPFEQAVKDDIRRVISAIHQTQLSEETKRCFKIMVRKFYCYIRGIEERGEYPDEVRWMKMELGVKHKKLPEELLTEEEVKSIVQACTCARDRALVATLAESGSRVSEVGLMRIKHVVFETYGARISMNGKTGSRKVLIINSTPYLQEWLNIHPHNDNPEAFLWCSPWNELLSYNRIMTIIKRAARVADVKKRIHPHLFRHSRATQLASIMSDSQLKNYLGWTQSSKMAGIYVHMSGKDADDAILKANNIVVHKEQKDPALKPTICLRCKLVNFSTTRFCNHCGFVLDQKTAQQLIMQKDKEKSMEEVLTSLLQDKEVLALLQSKIAIVHQER